MSPFESIRHESEDGQEYWSARELMVLLGYRSWQRFTDVVERATEACENSNHAASDHFSRDVKMVQLGSGAERAIEDVHLSRYACYLIVQNSDPSKPIVALGQTYFASQTRIAELAADQDNANGDMTPPEVSLPAQRDGLLLSLHADSPMLSSVQLAYCQVPQIDCWHHIAGLPFVHAPRNL